MAIRGRLCRICSGFGFDKDHPPFGKNVLAENNIFKPKAILKLGRLGEVRLRDCPLCKLVTFATLEIQRTENYSLDDGDEVGLWWLAHTPEGTVLSFVRLRSESTHTSSSGLYMPISQSQIDFGKHCLVEVCEFSRYVTLSYVWGSVPSLRLSRANRYRLMQPGAMRQAWHLIPKTIQDAITTTQVIGERYLWVDSLCLMQNDPEDLQDGTGVMDLIYEQSILCIIAAGGKDANAGLRGVGPGSRGTSQTTIAEIKPGLRLAVYTDPCYLLKDTVYDSRAWT
ncbi:unnamed protein product [Clonostachys byssicola]|uniref:Heterokaryon incompatibility domain-containing protein n=1 Tax=Clonostachys byssicola TaxID=160290 RepID=A0A9N9YDH8_9HYPO|nr:unnamed protein product [Clonostachys byssicola]